MTSNEFMKKYEKSSREQESSNLVKWCWVLIAVVLLFIVGFAVLRNDADSLPAANPLVGSWVMSGIQGPGTTRTITFHRDGTFTSRDTVDATGAAIQHIRGSWRIKNNVLLIRETWGSPEDRIPFAVLPNQELRFGSTVYKK